MLEGSFYSHILYYSTEDISFIKFGGMFDSRFISFPLSSSLTVFMEPFVLVCFDFSLFGVFVFSYITVVCVYVLLFSSRI